MGKSGLELVTDVYRAYLCPAVAILGILGNVGIIITFAYNFTNKFAIYCCALAVYNSLALVTNSLMDDFLGRGLAYLTNEAGTISVELLSEPWCLFMEYVPNVMYFSSSYVMVAFSLDRTLVIALPDKHSPYRGYGTILGVCVGLGILGAIVAAPLLFSFTLERNSSFPGSRALECRLTNMAAAKFGLYLKSVVIFVVPTVLVAVSNVAICGLLLRVRKKRRRLSSRRGPGAPGCEMGRVVAHLALSTVFLLLSVPLSITIILRLLIPDPEMCRTLDPGTLLCTQTYKDTVRHLSKLLSSLKDLSYAVNFLLYLLFIRTFKHDFLSVFKCLPRGSLDPQHLYVRTTSVTTRNWNNRSFSQSYGND